MSIAKGFSLGMVAFLLLSCISYAIGFTGFAASVLFLVGLVLALSGMLVVMLGGFGDKDLKAALLGFIIIAFGFGSLSLGVILLRGC